jgi:hypothetical protein
MATWQADQARHQREKKVAEATLQQQLENTHLKRLEEKKKRDAEIKQVEEQQKLTKAKKHKDKEVADAEVMVVSPTIQMEADAADLLVNSHLKDMMQGVAEEDAADDGEDQHSPAKSKQKTSTFVEAMASKPTIQPMAKSVKMSINTHKHTHPRVIVEASIKLTGLAPVQDLIVNLQELLKNRQFINKMFAFSPIDPDGMDKKIHETSGITTNMTMLGAHFKISSNGRNPFEKQKQWEKAKKGKEESRDPIVYLSLVMATGKNPKDLLPRIIHKWQHRGGILLRVKELQSFKSDTILAFNNIFTSTPKNYLLQEFCSIL